MLLQTIHHLSSYTGIEALCSSLGGIVFSSAGQLLTLFPDGSVVPSAGRERRVPFYFVPIATAKVKLMKSVSSEESLDEVMANPSAQGGFSGYTPQRIAHSTEGLYCVDDNHLSFAKHVPNQETKLEFQRMVTTELVMTIAVERDQNGVVYAHNRVAPFVCSIADPAAANEETDVQRENKKSKSPSQHASRPHLRIDHAASSLWVVHNHSVWLHSLPKLDSRVEVVRPPQLKGDIIASCVIHSHSFVVVNHGDSLICLHRAMSPTDVVQFFTSPDLLLPPLIRLIVDYLQMEVRLEPSLTIQGHHCADVTQTNAESVLIAIDNNIYEITRTN